MSNKLWKVMALFAATLVLVACGGGAADSGQVAELEAELANARATAEAAADAAAAGGGEGVSAEELAAAEEAIAALEEQLAEAQAGGGDAGGEDMGMMGPIEADALVECQPIPDVLGYISHDDAAYRVAPAAVAAEPATTVDAPAAQDGDTVYRVGVFEDVTSLNYWAANGPDNTVWNSYMLPSRLTLYGLSDRTFQFVPGVAAAMPDPLAEEDGKWVVEIPIRDDIFWSDGEPLTAEDVAFTANTSMRFGLIAGGWGSSWFDTNYLESVEAVDDYTVKFIYHTKTGLSRHQFGNLSAPILAEHFWGPLVDAAAAPLDALGDSPSEEELAAAQAEAADNLYAIVPDGEPLAGSFLFSTREPGAFVENSANPDYFSTGTTVIQYVDGTYQEVEASITSTYYGDGSGDVELEFAVGPNVVSAVYSVYGSQDAAILALRDGEVDFVLNPLGLQRGLLEQVQGDSNVTVLENSVNGFRYMGFNMRRKPMNDCAFRQAVAVLIDKEFVTGRILQGVAFPLYTFVPEANAAWYYNDVPKLGQGLSREERITLAVAILEQAGYTWADGQVPFWDADNDRVSPGGNLIMPDGTPVPHLDLLGPSAGYDPLRGTFAIWIESWLVEFGIPVEAELAGFNAIIPRIFTDHDFDFWILGWSLTLFPDYLYDFFAAEQAGPDGNNAGGYVNESFEELGQGLLECDTIESCKEIADEIQTIMSTEVPYVLLFDTGIIEAYRSASVEYPYTTTLSGLQYASGMPSTVKVK